MVFSGNIGLIQGTLCLRIQEMNAIPSRDQQTTSWGRGKGSLGLKVSPGSEKPTLEAVFTSGKRANITMENDHF